MRDQERYEGQAQGRRAGEEPCMPVLVLGVAWGQK